MPVGRVLSRIGVMPGGGKIHFTSLHFTRVARVALVELVVHMHLWHCLRLSEYSCLFGHPSQVKLKCPTEKPEDIAEDIISYCGQGGRPILAGVKLLVAGATTSLREQPWRSVP